MNLHGAKNYYCGPDGTKTNDILVNCSLFSVTKNVSKINVHSVF